MDKKILVSDLSYGSEELNAVKSVLQNEWLTMGPITNEFEKKFATYTHSPYAKAVSSATAALHLSLIEAGIKKNHEVITTPISFVASANCILYQKAKPVFADIDTNTWNISPEEIRKEITSKTKAIIVVHLAGLPVQLDEISEICNENNLILIEDCAHGVGSLFDGKHVGTFGEYGCFSFFSNKNLSTGEGGMILVSDSDKANNLKYRRSHGLTKSTWSRHVNSEANQDRLYDMKLLGFNYRMTEIQAVLGLEQLKKVNKMNKIRMDNFNHYKTRFTEENLIEYFQFQMIPSNMTHAHHILPVLLKKGKRHEFREHLARKNIGTSIHYTPIPEFTFYQQKGYNIKDYPNAKDFGHQVVTLPLHQKLSHQDIDYIISVIKSFIKQKEKKSAKR
jgi:dTDP-4-amino-4,6-dideoxygalactose transaminase